MKEKKIIYTHLSDKSSKLISEKEVISHLIEKKDSILFLGKYTIKEVIAVLKKRNFIQFGIKKGFKNLIYELDSKEFPTQRFRIFNEKKNQENLLVELKIREGKMKVKKSSSFFLPGKEYDFLIIEWLTLQNPLEKFTNEKPRLPGQLFPGLGIAKKVLDLFTFLAKLMKKDGILIYPWYFHNALMYLKYFYFINPRKQAEVLAIRNKFSDLNFSKLAWVVYLECLKNKTGKTYKWFAEEQIYPLKSNLKKYFKSNKYKKIVSKFEKKIDLYVDWDCYFEKIKSKQGDVPR